jgi:hypothetical protein
MTLAAGVAVWATHRRLRLTAFALLIGPGIGWPLGNLAGDRAAGRRYASIAWHEEKGLETCYVCFHALDASELRQPVAVQIPVCSACTRGRELAVGRTALENWKAAQAERLQDLERRGWMRPDRACRWQAVYANAVLDER